MASTVYNTYHRGREKKMVAVKNSEETIVMSTKKNDDDQYINTPVADDDDFDFVMAYDDDPAEGDERLLPDNDARSAITCGFIGVGGGGGKLAKAFLDN